MVMELKKNKNKKTGTILKITILSIIFYFILISFLVYTIVINLLRFFSNSRSTINLNIIIKYRRYFIQVQK